MTEAEIIELVRGGEGINVEFKRSATAITKDVYDTVCAFSNRDGGVILLGVSDDGTITGVAPEAIDHMKADFVTAINNAENFIRRFICNHRHLRWRGTYCLSSRFHRVRRFAGIAGEFLIAIMKRTSILQTVWIWFISCTRARAAVILSIKLRAFKWMICAQISSTVRER